MIDITYEATVGEVLASNDNVIKSKKYPPYQKAVKGVSLYATVIFCLIAFVVMHLSIPFFETKKEIIFPVITFIVCFFIVKNGTPKAYYFGRKNALRRQLKTMIGDDAATLSYRLILSENRLSLESFLLQNIRYLSKEDIVFYQIVDNSVFCFDDKNRGVLIPLGCIASEEKEKIIAWFDAIM